MSILFDFLSNYYLIFGCICLFSLAVIFVVLIIKLIILLKEKKIKNIENGRIAYSGEEENKKSESISLVIDDMSNNTVSNNNSNEININTNTVNNNVESNLNDVSFNPSLVIEDKSNNDNLQDSNLNDMTFNPSLVIEDNNSNDASNVPVSKHISKE